MEQGGPATVGQGGWARRDFASNALNIGIECIKVLMISWLSNCSIAMRIIAWIIVLCSGCVVLLGHSEPTAAPQPNASNKAEPNPKSPISPSPATLSNVVTVKSAQQTNSTKKVDYKETSISRQSATFSNVVASAKEFTGKWHDSKGRALTWGNPIEVRWQPEPLNRYIVLYPTSESEKAWVGQRAVIVATNGLACFAPRE